MRLLFDENISFRIVKKCADLFPGSIHITDVHPKIIGDTNIFQYARANGFLIVTFDEDFINIQSIKGYPPKIIWLRTGNTSTLNVGHRLSENKDAILELERNPDLQILEIY